MPKNEHTPTPWDYKRAKFPTDGEFDCGITAPIAGTPFCIAETFGRCAATIKLDAEANAAFIVKAVNSHDDLVAALNFALSELDYIIGKHGYVSTETAAVRARKALEEVSA